MGMIIKENQSILIPVDFSKQSYIAVKQTYTLAKFTKSKIILLHVSAVGSDDRGSDLEALAQTTREESGLAVEAINLQGDVYELTNKKAEELGCSLVVLALDENAKFKTGIFGGGSSVPKFLQAANCPVITLRSVENRDGLKNIVMPFDLTPESREK